MYYPLSLFIGLRYTRSKRNNRFVSFITLFSTAGITIGVLALITVLSVMNGFEQDLKVRILGAVPHVIVTPKAETKDVDKSLSALTDDPLVAAVTPFLQADAMVQSKSQIQGAQLQGIDPSTYPEWDVIRQNMLIGDISLLQPGKYNIIIGRSMARSLNVNLGDKIRLISTKGSVFTPMGRVPSQRKFTVVGIYSVGSDVEATQVLVNITDAGKLARLKPSSQMQHRVFVHDPFSVNELASRDFFSDFDSLDWQTARGELFQAVKMEKNMIGLLLFLIITVAVFNILSSLVMLVTEKETDVAIMKTLGMNRPTIVQIFVTQGAWTGVLGAIAGGIMGIALAANLNEFMSLIGLNLLAQASGGARLLPVLFDWSQIASIIFGAIALSLLATLYPAFRAANVKPAEALRYE
ncbi:lipoprotein-releasing ABC transporter permease subunit [Moritella viscosa]|uniref:ABC transporter integral membrane subunit n=1 Tax=Moritella viscosa TaxID=80854 RepID=A0ABY1HJH1_9GAMM|nr:lipoprotein-releasing ABC transporter permease subunit [Moritella viscosa]SGY98454.1 Putative ABC transporter integral membrane subunit [Moritella viscosa]SGZ12499.1 Putative ABC transporter integral membrane subunit [Moritella viscosa]SHO27717.1 Putative ABC transporter integral membrane subunit [Moritella viscosa]